MFEKAYTINRNGAVEEYRLVPSAIKDKKQLAEIIKALQAGAKAVSGMVILTKNYVFDCKIFQQKFKFQKVFFIFQNVFLRTNFNSAEFRYSVKDRYFCSSLENCQKFRKQENIRNVLRKDLLMLILIGRAHLHCRT